MYTNNRDAYRQFFFTTWQKHAKKLALDPSEARLAAIIEEHPEYHPLLEKPDTSTQQEFALEENPFFHMSLHFTLREQIDMNRPDGIRLIQQQLKIQHTDNHHVEHLMMECLCKMMALSQETGATPSDEAYLQALRAIPN